MDEFFEQELYEIDPTDENHEFDLYYEDSMEDLLRDEGYGEFLDEKERVLG